jgi:S1-C subfamily serine protease
VTPDIAEKFDLKRPAGAVVTTVTPRSPAARAGLKTGDVIISVDGQGVDDPNAFDYRFATRPLGGQVPVTIVRSGKESRVSVALETAPDSPRDEISITGRSPLQGLKVANLSPALADELRLETTATGVVVTDVPDGSPGQTVGFQKGDIFVSVNGTKIDKTADLDKLTKAGGRLWRITIQRGGQEISAVFGG